MHPDQYALKEPRTEKGKQDNGFSVYYGLVQTFGAYQPHPPQRARWGTFPNGEGMGAAAPQQPSYAKRSFTAIPNVFPLSRRDTIILHSLWVRHPLQTVQNWF